MPYTRACNFILRMYTFLPLARSFSGLARLFFVWRDFFFAGATFFCRRDFFLLVPGKQVVPERKSRTKGKKVYIPNMKMYARMYGTNRAPYLTAVNNL